MLVLADRNFYQVAEILPAALPTEAQTDNLGHPTDQTDKPSMRAADTFTESLFTMRHLDDFVPADHPLHVIRMMVNKALANMDGLFAQMYAADVKGGRPSIAAEKLLRAMLIQVLYRVRSERQLMEQTQYNLLFRRFILYF